jgi:predicted transglutaminase-like protease
MNIIDSLILAIISLIGILYILYLNLGPDQEQHSTSFLIVLCLDFTLPLIGIFVIIIFKIFKNKIPTSWIKGCSKNCCRSSKIETLDEGTNEAQISPTVTMTTITTTTEVGLPDRILHPHRYVKERSDEN